MLLSTKASGVYFMQKPRPYQKQAIEALWSALIKTDKALCVLPTAAGKTFVFHEILNRASKLPNFKSVVLLNRRELVAQTFERLSKNLDCGIYDAELKQTSQQIIIASLQSCYRQEFKGTKLIICDEAHAIGNEGMYAEFFARNNKTKVLGFTATPYRDNRLCVGKEFFFPEITFKRDVSYLLKEGYLTPPICRALPKAFDTSQLTHQKDDFKLSELVKLVSDTTKVRQQVEDAMSRLHGRKKIVWVCTTIEHAELVKKFIPEPSAIRHSRHINDAGQKYMFEQTDCRHCVSVMMISEGWDYPPTDAIVIMRPTRSIKLAIQVIGRGLRLHEGKKDCLILDYGEVIKNCGPIDDPLINTSPIGRRQKLEVNIKLCQECYAINKKTAQECSDCNKPFPKLEINRLKNTTKNAYSGSLLSEGKAKPWQEIVTEVVICTHKAKSGNNCIRIDYQTENKYPRSEFFTSLPFSFKLLKERLMELGINTQDLVFDELFNKAKGFELVPQKVPVSITLQTEREYAKIKKLHFEDNREPSGTVSFNSFKFP